MELLVVLAIIAILTAASTSAFQSVLQSSNLSQAGQTLTEEINLARQIASARNTTVEVRLIKLAQVQNPSATGYNAIQLFRPPTPSETEAGATAMVALAQRVILPSSVVISQDSSNYSQLLFEAALNPTAMTVPGGSASYAAFHIMPSGLVQVMNGIIPIQSTTMSALYLSLVPAIYGQTSTAPGSAGAPANYFLVQINPNTGTTSVYRP